MVTGTTSYHAVDWLDHHEARVVHFGAEASDELIVRPVHPQRQLHSKVGSP